MTRECENSIKKEKEIRSDESPKISFRREDISKNLLGHESGVFQRPLTESSGQQVTKELTELFDIKKDNIPRGEMAVYLKYPYKEAINYDGEIPMSGAMVLVSGEANYANLYPGSGLDIDGIRATPRPPFYGSGQIPDYYTGINETWPSPTGLASVLKDTGPYTSHESTPPRPHPPPSGLFPSGVVSSGIIETYGYKSTNDKFFDTFLENGRSGILEQINKDTTGPGSLSGTITTIGHHPVSGSWPHWPEGEFSSRTVRAEDLFSDLKIFFPYIHYYPKEVEELLSLYRVVIVKYPIKIDYSFSFNVAPGYNNYINNDLNYKSSLFTERYANGDPVLDITGQPIIKQHFPEVEAPPGSVDPVFQVYPKLDYSNTARRLSSRLPVPRKRAIFTTQAIDPATSLPTGIDHADTSSYRKF